MVLRASLYLWCFSFVLLTTLVVVLVLGGDNWTSWKPPAPQSSNLDINGGGHLSIRLFEENVETDVKSPKPKWKIRHLNRQQVKILLHPEPLQDLQTAHWRKRDQKYVMEDTTPLPDPGWTREEQLVERETATFEIANEQTSTPGNVLHEEARDDSAALSRRHSPSPGSPATERLEERVPFSSTPPAHRLRQVLNSQTTESSRTQIWATEPSTTEQVFSETQGHRKEAVIARTGQGTRMNHNAEILRRKKMFSMSRLRANRESDSESNGVSDETGKLFWENSEKKLDVERDVNVLNETMTQFSRGKSKLILWYQPANFIPSTPLPVPLSNCPSVKCHVTTNRRFLLNSSALLFAARTAYRVAPPLRLPGQVWVLHNHERPLMEFPRKQWIFKEPFRGFINWTMGYRRESDIWQPYGLIVPRAKLRTARNYSAIVAAKTGSVAWLVSHCPTKGQREDYVRELRRHLAVDVYGECGDRICPRRRDEECVAMIERKYKFYLAFENRLCRDYVTEKFFRFFGAALVVVVRGGADYSLFAPNGTYINAADFRSARELGAYLNFLSRDDRAYIRYLQAKDQWESRFETYPIRGKNGVTQYSTYHFLQRPMCELCQRLWHLQEHRRSYGNIGLWLHQPICQPPRDLGN